MALKKMIEIVDEIMSKNDEIKRCYVAHRLGTIKTGEPSIIIATCSKGRDDCSKETMNILCKIKEQVPVFKKAIFESDAIVNEVVDDDALTDDCKESSRKDVYNKEVEMDKNEMSIATSDGGEVDLRPETSTNQLKTNWIMKSEAFWLRK